MQTFFTYKFTVAPFHIPFVHPPVPFITPLLLPVQVIITSLRDGFPGFIQQYLRRHEVLVLLVVLVSFVLGIPNVYHGGIYFFQVGLGSACVSGSSVLLVEFYLNWLLSLRFKSLHLGVSFVL